MTIAIIGAGLAGLACARALVAAGSAVRVFDKGRAPGGRVATRRIGALRFDHGAQYVSIRGPDFAAALAGAPLAAWPDPERRVGLPGMSALPRYLAEHLDLRSGCEIHGIGGVAGAWTLRHGKNPAVEAGPFTALGIAIPPAQAVRMLAPVAPALPPQLGGVRMAPCWTVMAAFAAKLPLPDTLRPADGPIGWAARDSAKPGRDPATECWVVQAAPDWSRARLEDSPEPVVADLLASLAALAGAALPPLQHGVAHRWRFAAVERPLNAPCLWDPLRRLGLAGDWCIGARAEAAFDSGVALAAAMRG